jgi:hypothetical protein
MKLRVAGLQGFYNIVTVLLILYPFVFLLIKKPSKRWLFYLIPDTNK